MQGKSQPRGLLSSGWWEFSGSDGAGMVHDRAAMRSLKLIAGMAAAVATVAPPGVAGAEPTSNRILPITYDCGSAGTFVLEGHQHNFQPQGRLNGRMVKISW